jgi:hypothetical protein
VSRAEFQDWLWDGFRPPIRITVAIGPSDRTVHWANAKHPLWLVASELSLGDTRSVLDEGG